MSDWRRVRGPGRNHLTYHHASGWKVKRGFVFGPRGGKIKVFHAYSPEGFAVVVSRRRRDAFGVVERRSS